VGNIVFWMRVARQGVYCSAIFGYNQEQITSISFKSHPENYINPLMQPSAKEKNFNRKEKVN
jgi:hypothetical protein